LTRKNFLFDTLYRLNIYYVYIMQRGHPVSIKYAILGLLQYKDMHGYRIKSRIERDFGHMWTINYGQIYPNLKQLRKDGLVTVKEVNISGEKGPPRKLYSITPEGKEAFLTWLEKAPERPMLLRDPFLMRFVFFGFGDRSRAVELIDEQIGLYQKQLGTREKNLERFKEQDVYVRLITQLGLGLNRILLEWLEKARAEIMNAPIQD
jgi:DNA-binding PadR family transcriptional regulator